MINEIGRKHQEIIIAKIANEAETNIQKFIPKWMLLKTSLFY